MVVGTTGATETRFAIVDALEKLMRTKPIDDVKVTDICREAHIGRTTFYGHFENVYAVATWCWASLLEESLFLIEGGLGFLEAHVTMFDKALLRKDFFRRAFRTSDYNSVTNYGFRTMFARYIGMAIKFKGAALTVEEELAISLFTSGAAYVTSTWAKEGMVESPKEMATAFALALPEILSPMLNATSARNAPATSKSAEAFTQR